MPFFSKDISLLVISGGLESGADGFDYYCAFSYSSYKGDKGLGITLFLFIKPGNNEGGYEPEGSDEVKRAERPGKGF